MSDATIQLGAYGEGFRAGQDEMLRYFGAALDEIYRLRAALAIEALIISTYLDLKTFPRGQRALAELQSDRMRAAARGESPQSYADVRPANRQASLLEVGGQAFLTRHQWEREVDQRTTATALPMEGRAN